MAKQINISASEVDLSSWARGQQSEASTSVHFDVNTTGRKLHVVLHDDGLVDAFHDGVSTSISKDVIEKARESIADPSADSAKISAGFFSDFRRQLAAR